jgi:hypothetical protein
MWTFSLDDGETVRATVQLTTRVQKVYQGTRLVSSSTPGGPREHAFVLEPGAKDRAQPAGDPARAEPYRAREGRRRQARLTIDTRTRTCTLLIDGRPVEASSFEDVSDVTARHDGLPPSQRSIHLRKGAGALAASVIALATSLVMLTSFNRIWYFGFVFAGGGALIGLRYLAMALAPDKQR